MMRKLFQLVLKVFILSFDELSIEWDYRSVGCTLYVGTIFHILVDLYAYYDPWEISDGVQQTYLLRDDFSMLYGDIEGINP